MARSRLNDLKVFLADDPDCRFWMGVDVHKNSYHLALRRDDENLFTWSAPTVHHSGEKTPRKYLVPVGQTRLCSLLVEAAWIWRTKDEYARLQYHKLMSRTGIP